MSISFNFIIGSKWKPPIENTICWSLDIGYCGVPLYLLPQNQFHIISLPIHLLSAPNPATMRIKRSKLKGLWVCNHYWRNSVSGRYASGLQVQLCLSPQNHLSSITVRQWVGLLIFCLAGVSALSKIHTNRSYGVYPCFCFAIFASWQPQKSTDNFCVGREHFSTT